MSKPVPGALYIVQELDLIGGTSTNILDRIAEIAYGDSAKSADIDVSNQITQIGVGTVLKMPSAVLSDQEPDIKVETPGLVLLVGGVEILTESIRFFQSDETMVDAWSAVIEWVPGKDLKADELFAPYAYTKALVYLDGELLSTGRIYGVSPSLSDRQEITLDCFSLAVDVLDSSLAPPYEESNVTFKQRAQTVLKPFGLSVTLDLIDDGVFDRVTADDTKTAGAHLMDLARQRAALISSTPKGGLSIVSPAVSGSPVAEITEGQPGFSGFASTFDGRERFSDYRIEGETPSDNILTSVVQDKEVSVTRFKTIKVKDTTEGGLSRAANWEKIRYLSKSLSVPITAEGFKTNSGKRWTKGDYVTLISPTLFIPKGRLMRIRAVEFLSDVSGQTTTLSLVPAEIYDLEENL